jgi:hypothetical protein
MPIIRARLKAEGLDLVIGSRYAAGASTGEWSPAAAAAQSARHPQCPLAVAARRAARSVERLRLLRREVLDGYLASAIVGAAWNYGASRFFTWGGARR